MVKIILDVYGADHSPHEILKGAIDAVNGDSGIVVSLAGNEKEMREILSGFTYNQSQIEFINASEVITNEESPTEAIRAKKDSSLIRAIDALNEDESIAGLVTAGSTGAVLSGSIFKIGRLKGIQRPALAPVMPTLTGSYVTVVDCGANVDSKPQFLTAFAVMGSAYMRALQNYDKPRVALLSNGVEDKKGNTLVHETFPLLKEIDCINFVGNMEARECLSGDYDVVVSDGFAGNVLVKSIEGTAKAFAVILKQEIMKSTMAKMGYPFMKKAMKSFKDRFNVDKAGGAPLLGIKRLVVKAHGSAKSVAICASIMQVKRLHEEKLIERMTADIENANLKVVRDV